MVYIKSFIIWCVLGVAVLVGFMIGLVMPGDMPKGEKGGADVQQG